MLLALALYTPFFIGLKFWKAPNRKVFAVQEEELVRESTALPSTSSGRKRRRVDYSPSELCVDEALVPLTEKVDTLVSDIDTIKGQLQQVFKVTKCTEVPLSLKQSIHSTFQCKICRSIMTPPVIFSKCCRLLLGCVACVDEWYAGPNGLMKNCPNCNLDRGYAEIVRMAGMDEFLDSIRPLYGDADSEA